MNFLGLNITWGGNGEAFEGAKPSRSRGKVPGPRPTDAKFELTQMTRSELTKNARYLDKNSGLVRSMSRDMQLYAVGDGIRAQGATDNHEWNRAAERAWNDWARMPDITRRYSLVFLEHIISRTIDRDGEIFVVRVFDAAGSPKIQLIESHRCVNGDNPPKGMAEGILWDEFGAPVKYRFANDDGTFRDVPAEAVHHLHDPESITATRHRTPLTHAINRLIDEAELIAMSTKGTKDQMQVTRVVTTAEGTAESVGAGFGTTAAEDMDTSGASDAKKIDAALGGATAVLGLGSTVTNLTPNIPNPAFSGQIQHLRRDASGGIVPYEFIDGISTVGGAGVRLVVGKAARVFEHRQLILIDQLLNGLWAWVIAHEISVGLLAPSPDFFRVSWVTPRKVTVDAGRDANANRQDVQVGLKTFSDDYAERGMDYEEELRRRAREARLRKDIAAEFDIPERDLYDPAPNVAPTVAIQQDPNA